jgi:nitrite reductase (NADH) small subunit
MTEPTWHDLGPVESFPDRSLQGRLVGGARLCVGRSSETHFAIDDTCPHAGGSLSEGLVDGDLVICPLHAWAFEIDTGTCIDDAHCSVSAYPLRVEDGRLKVLV